MMATVQQIEVLAENLLTCAKTLAKQCRENGLSEHFATWDASSANSSPANEHQVPREANRLRQNMFATLMQLQIMLATPRQLIQQLAYQIQLMACLQWLGEFQVLACVPLDGAAMGIEDVADLVGVPEKQLRLVVRLTASAGFLREPEPDHVAHTDLSASFVTQLPNLDALMFLGRRVAPAALRMSDHTQDHSVEHGADRGQLTTYAVSPLESKSRSSSGSLSLSLGFRAAWETDSRLQRQWSAYLGCMGDTTDVLVDLFDQLDWSSLGNASVVDVGADSLSIVEAFAKRYPDLRFIAQMRKADVPDNASLTGLLSSSGLIQPASRITIRERAAHEPQNVQDAAVYALRGPRVPTGAPDVWIQAELHAHLAVLRAAPDATLLLALQIRPDPGSVDIDVEVAACVRNMTLFQLPDVSLEMDLVEVEVLVQGIGDNGGHLVVVNKLRSRHCSTVTLAIKYKVSKSQPLGAIGPPAIPATDRNGASFFSI